MSAEWNMKSLLTQASVLITHYSELLRVCRFLSGALVAPDQHENSDQHHRYREDLAHGNRTKNKAQVLIRFTEQFDDEPADTVPSDEGPEDRPRWGRSPINQPQHREQRQPFQRCLVQLGGMAAGGPSSGKDHAPVDIGRPAEELTIDEVPNSSAPQTDRCDRGREVCDGVDGNPLLSAEPDQGEDRPQEPAVEGHPSLPHCEKFQGVLAVVRKVIEERVADPSSKKHAEGGIDNHVIDLVLPDRQLLPRHIPPNEKIRGGEPDQVHQPIPAKLNGTESDNNRI